MKVKVREILGPLNISDSGCESKIQRINDILTNFSIDAYELYTLKRTEYFNPTQCETQFQTKYPITRVRGFYGEGCASGCAIDAQVCCGNYVKLLLEMSMGEVMPPNSFWIDYDKTIHLHLGGNVSSGMIHYSRGFDAIVSLDDEIEIDKYTLSLLRYYIRAEYALEGDNDANTYSVYRNRFSEKIKKMNEMMMNHVKFIQPGGYQIKAQR